MIASAIVAELRAVSMAREGRGEGHSDDHASYRQALVDAECFLNTPGKTEREQLLLLADLHNRSWVREDVGAQRMPAYRQALITLFARIAELTFEEAKNRLDTIRED